MRSLYGKLALVLFGLFCLTGGLLLAATLYTAHMYQQEVTQRLNRDLAGYIVNEHVLMAGGKVNQDNLKALFHTLMIINPSVELYLLDPAGRILAYSAAPEKIQRQSVALAPLQRLLAGAAPLPVLGDDPRSTDRQKAFSAAPIDIDGQRQGYIYAILGGEQADNIAELLARSYILRWGAGAMGTALLFALFAALLLFALLTRRLRALGQDMERFRRSDFAEPLPQPPAEHNSDEIGRMRETFAEMAGRIREQMGRLKQTDSLRRELVANVSHDLRTPLASMRGYLETLLLKDESLSAEDRRRYLETANRHAERLGHLIEELFELAKLDARELKPRPEPFSLAELVHDVAQKFELRAAARNIRLEVQIDDSIPFAEADIGLIERVLDNLIENALQHTPEGGSIKLMLNDARDRVIVRVADTGHGIPSEDLPHVFERFYRRIDGGNNGTGAGLGLAIAQRIVALHGGTLQVESAVEHGSTFSFDLPVYNFSSR